MHAWLGISSGLNVEALDREIGPEQPFEHGRIIAEALGEVTGRAAGLEDGKLHGLRLATSWPFGQWQSERGAPWPRTTGSRAAMP